MDPEKLHDTNELDVAAILQCAGWTLLDIKLVTNSQTGRAFGRFYFEAPEGVTRSTFLRQMHNGLLRLDPKRLLSLRKDLKSQVDDQARSSIS